MGIDYWIDCRRRGEVPDAGQRSRRHLDHNGHWHRRIYSRHLPGSGHWVVSGGAGRWFHHVSCRCDPVAAHLPRNSWRDGQGVTTTQFFVTATKAYSTIFEVCSTEILRTIVPFKEPAMSR